MVRFWQPYGTGLAIHVQGMLKQCYKKQEQHFLHNSESLCLFLIFLSKPNTEYLINVMHCWCSCVCLSVGRYGCSSVCPSGDLSIYRFIRLCWDVKIMYAWIEERCMYLSVLIYLFIAEICPFVIFLLYQAC